MTVFKFKAMHTHTFNLKLLVEMIH